MGTTKLSLFFEEAHFGFKIIDGIKQAILLNLGSRFPFQREYLENSLLGDTISAFIP